jgi:hypothetical protein
VRARRLIGIGTPRDGLVGRAEASLVGRGWEMAALDAISDRAIDGRGGVVNVVGPAGGHMSRTAQCPESALQDLAGALQFEGALVSVVGQRVAIPLSSGHIGLVCSYPVYWRLAGCHLRTRSGFDLVALYAVCR